AFGSAHRHLKCWHPMVRGRSSAAEPAEPASSSGARRGVRRDRETERNAAHMGRRPMEREILKLQQDHNFLSIPKTAFGRLVRDIQSSFAEEPLRFSSEALELLQMATEEYLMYLFADGYLATAHRRRVTLSSEDVRLVRRLRQPHCWGETR
ncbi:Histone H3 (H3S) (Histone H3-I/H3-II) (Major histone H3) [Cleaved into: H3F], partial [Durusdinium trenchii]